MKLTEQEKTAIYGCVCLLCGVGILIGFAIAVFIIRSQ